MLMTLASGVHSSRWLHAANGGERMGLLPSTPRDRADARKGIVRRRGPWFGRHPRYRQPDRTMAPNDRWYAPRKQAQATQGPTKPAALRGKPKRSEEADESLEARRLRTPLTKWHRGALSLASVLISSGKSCLLNLPCAGRPERTCTRSQDNVLEARATPKGGKSGKSTMNRIGSGLGTAAAFAPLIGLGIDAVNQGQMRRDIDEQFWARGGEDDEGLEARDFVEEFSGRGVEDDDHLEARAPPKGGKSGKSTLSRVGRDLGGKSRKSTLSRIGSGLGTAAAFAPLIGLGLDAVNQGQMRRELYEELFARDVDDELEERDFDDADDLVAATWRSSWAGKVGCNNLTLRKKPLPGKVSIASDLRSRRAFESLRWNEVRKVSRSDYRGLKKRITAIRRASPQTVDSPAGSTTHLSVNESPRSSNDHNDNGLNGQSTVAEHRGHASSLQGQCPFVPHT
ncbi:hypothetical protein IMY05_C4619000300 [Salix suchowensis]|nr:hypothetical protein IMY05_C4619000300 [Salix suchowensis]